MKKLFLFLWFTFYILLSAFSQNPLVKQWDKRFGGTQYEWLGDLKQTADGGYIIGASSYSDSSGDKTGNSKGGWDYWIIKIDSIGNKEWDKDFGGTDQDYLNCITTTMDGGYILGGFSSSGISGDKTCSNWGNADYWIIKIDSLGNKEWDRGFGGSVSESLLSVHQTNDGGYILCGQSSSDISGDKTENTWGGLNDYDFWIVKTNSLGVKQWDKDLGGFNNDFEPRLQLTNDGGYILGGYSYSGIGGDKTQPTWGSMDYWIVKVDSLGNKEWDKDYGAIDGDVLRTLKRTTDGGYILGGTSNSGVSGDKTQPNWASTGNTNDYWVVKIDSVGNKQWDKDFGGIDNEEQFVSIIETNDLGYLMAGSSYSNIGGDKTENNLGPAQTWVVKTDLIGNKQWDKTLHTNATPIDVGSLANQISPCYTFANFTQADIGGDKTQPSWGGYDIWIIKFCDSTSTTGITNFQPPASGFQIIPNPANESFQVSGFRFQVNKIEIFNLLGETVFSDKPETLNFKLQTLNFPSGIYIIKAYTEKGVFQQKLVINH